MNTTTLNMTTLDGGVIIKKGGGGTPTPPSGGGENTYEYLELTRPEGWEGDDFIGEVVTPLIILCALLGKVELNGSVGIMTPYMIAIQQVVPTAIAYDPNMLVQAGPTDFMKVSEVIQMYGIPDLPRLTKEQFYSLD